MENLFKELPREVLENVKEFHCPPVHPTAQLIKQLVFDRDENGERSVFNDRCPSLYVSTNFMTRRYILTDFIEPDRYIEESDILSGFILGRVMQTNREYLIERFGAFRDNFTYATIGFPGFHRNNRSPFQERD